MDEFELTLEKTFILLGIDRPEVTHLNYSIINILNEIEANHKNLERISIPQISQKEVKQNTQKFMMEKFKLHKIKYKGFLSNIENRILPFIKSEDMARILVNNTGVNINPFKLPVNFIGVNGRDIGIVYAGIYRYNDSYLFDTIPYFSYINLEQKPNLFTDSSYVHELTHSQLIDKEKKIKNFYNFEVLSVFLESLIIYEKNSDLLCRIADQYRLYELLEYRELYYEYINGIEDHSYGELIECGKYFESDLKAYYLLIEYINGSPTIKKYILSSIQDIFDAKLDLESFLDNIGATIDNIYQDRRLIKYFCR